MLLFFIKLMYISGGLLMVVNTLTLTWQSIKHDLYKTNIVSILLGMAVFFMAFVIDTIYYIVANLV